MSRPSESQSGFIKQLRDGAALSLSQTARLLGQHGYPCSKARVAQLETGAPLTSQAQLAYCRAFSLSPSDRLLLQRLAGEAAGCPPVAEHAA